MGEVRGPSEIVDSQRHDLVLFNSDPKQDHASQNSITLLIDKAQGALRLSSDSVVGFFW